MIHRSHLARRISQIYWIRKFKGYRRSSQQSNRNRLAESLTELRKSVFIAIVIHNHTNCFHIAASLISEGMLLVDISCKGHYVLCFWTCLYYNRISQIVPQISLLLPPFPGLSFHFLAPRAIVPVDIFKRFDFLVPTIHLLSLSNPHFKVESR